ncbi:MAG: hypothetical protein OEV06_03635 [Anaerolineae bacterium]|nr:hypothetical protein [Anaerolineae bacterium]
MQANTLYRLSGVSAIIAAILLLILGVGFLVVGDPNVPQFIFYSLSGGVAHIFFMFVLMGIYLKQHQQMGWLGLVGFGMTMAANALFTTGQLSSAYVVINDAIFSSAALWLTIGLLILAIANHRAGVLPKWAGWLMFVGHAVNYTSLTGVGIPIIVQIALFAVGIVWMGLAVMRPAPAGGE